MYNKFVYNIVKNIIFRFYIRIFIVYILIIKNKKKYIFVKKFNLFFNIMNNDYD